MSSRPLPDLALQLTPVSPSSPAARARVERFEVCFASLFRQGHSYAFPCDESGKVVVDLLPDAAQRNYLAACARVGAEYALPQVRPMAGFTH
jgi:hypothetical protein